MKPIFNLALALFSICLLPPASTLVHAQQKPLLPLSLAFDAKNPAFAWDAKIGSTAYIRPAVSGGKVFIGTSNEAGYRDGIAAKDDKGVLLCLDDKDGKFLWQLTRDKLESSRENDLPWLGITSQPCVEGDRLWLVTNRAEIMCLDTEGFLDGENDGVYRSEKLSSNQDADIVWSLDMMKELKVFPHEKAVGDPVILENLLFINTSNGVDKSHLKIPSPASPNFLAIDKNTGKIVWKSNLVGNSILHHGWASPAIGIIDGVPQVYFPGGDGWLYAFHARTGDLIWKCDLNPKESVWRTLGRGNRNTIFARPVVYKNSVIIGVGQDPQYGDGRGGHLLRIDATGTGDVSQELGEIEKKGRPNPNSKIIWHFGGVDDENEQIFGRTLSSPVITPDGLLFASDLAGYHHCLDVETGKRHWKHDLLSEVWSSPILYRDHILFGDREGVSQVFKASKSAHQPKTFDTKGYEPVYSTFHVVGDSIYVPCPNKLTKFNFKIK